MTTAAPKLRQSQYCRPNNNYTAPKTIDFLRRVAIEPVRKPFNPLRNGIGNFEQCLVWQSLQTPRYRANHSGFVFRSAVSVKEI
jgi:hypothetical protein